MLTYIRICGHFYLFHYLSIVLQFWLIYSEIVSLGEDATAISLFPLEVNGINRTAIMDPTTT